MIKLGVIGAIVILFCSVFACVGSNRYFDKKINEYKEFLSLFYLLKHKISSSATKINDIMDGIDESEYTDLRSFILKARIEGVYRSYVEIENELLINRDDKKIIKACFFDMGKNMISAELENIDICLKSLEKNYETIKLRTSSDKRVNNTVIICVTLLVLILIA